MIIKHKIKHYADGLTTPNEIFELCQRRWNVKCNLDVSATRKNTKCKRFITKRQNFLKRFKFSPNDVLWGNFPHSQNKKFVKHAYNIWRANNCRMVLLLPINTLCSNYAKRFILPYVMINRKIIITGRIQFLNPKTLKPSKYNSVNGYVTVFYNKLVRKI